MSEDEPKPELGPVSQVLTRSRLRDTFRQVVEATGINNPAELPTNDLDVAHAWEQLARWQDQERERIECLGSPAHQVLAHKISSATILADAGFTDPNYLETVIKDLYLYQSEARQIRSSPLITAIRLIADNLKAKERFEREAPTALRRNVTPPLPEVQATGAPIDIKQIVRACEGVVDQGILDELHSELTDPEEFFTALCEELSYLSVKDIPLFFRNRGVTV